MNYRIRELRKSLNLSQKEFAEKIGLKQNAISYMEKSGATVTEQNIKTICSQFNVNENWLRTGNGKMFIENEIKQKEFFHIFDKLSPELQDYLLRTAKDLLETQRKMQYNNNITNIHNIADNETEIAEELTTEELEEEYKKILHSASKTNSTVLPTTKETNENTKENKVI